MVLLSTTLSLNQYCSNAAPTPCPPNSHCKTNNYCACNPNFIGNCSTPAIALLNNQPVATLLPEKRTVFFSVKPITDKAFIKFEWAICQDSSQAEIVVAFWDENGDT